MRHKSFGEDNMNTDSFTDEQLLNLVNNTIKDRTKYSPDEFTGGSVQATTAYNNKISTVKVILMFGYDSNNNSKSFQREIASDTYYIWAKAIMHKVNSMLTKNIGADLNELNDLMKNNTDRDNKIEIVDRDRASNNLSTNNSTNKNKPFSFSLKQLTQVENLSKDYLLQLKVHVEASNRSLSYEEFINGLEANGKKYKNFKSAYTTWANNKDKWDNEKPATTNKKQPQNNGFILTAEQAKNISTRQSGVAL